MTNEQAISNFQFLIPKQNTNPRLANKNAPLDFYQTINIQNEQFKEDFSPVDPSCDCLLCTRYTRAYLRHLFQSREPLAILLATMHNLRFYLDLMARLRRAIEFDSLNQK